MTVVYDARQLLLEPLPDLDISPYRTTSDAVHEVKFIGTIRPWGNFKSEVQLTYNTGLWSPTPVAVMFPPGFTRGTIDEEQVFVSSEQGIQGRLEGRAGTRMGAVFGVQHVPLKLGAYKGVLPRILATRDSRTSSLKTKRIMLRWWGKPRHPGYASITSDTSSETLRLGRTQTTSDNYLVSIKIHQPQDVYVHTRIGQIAEYMFDLDLKYGFLTTYEQTIFLRKVNVGSDWVLEYSPIIQHNHRGSASGRTVSLRQCLYHVGLLALSNPVFDKTVRFRNPPLWITKES